MTSTKTEVRYPYTLPVLGSSHSYALSLAALAPMKIKLSFCSGDHPSDFKSGVQNSWTG